MKFGKQLKAQSVPQWRGLYVSYKALKTLLKKYSYGLELGTIEFEDTDLYRLLEDDLNKVDAFYTDKASTFFAEFESIKKNLLKYQRDHDTSQRKVKETTAGLRQGPSDSPDIDTKQDRRKSFADRDAKVRAPPLAGPKSAGSVPYLSSPIASQKKGRPATTLKEADAELRQGATSPHAEERKLKEYKRALLELCVLANELQHYRALNLTAIRKIIKKIDKKGYLDPPRKQLVMEEVALRPFFISTRVNDMTVHISFLYKDVFFEDIETGLAERKSKLERRRVIALLPNEFLKLFTASHLIAVLVRLGMHIYYDSDTNGLSSLLTTLSDELLVGAAITTLLWLSWGIPFNSFAMSTPVLTGVIFYIATNDTNPEEAFSQTVVLALYQTIAGFSGIFMILVLHYFKMRAKVSAAFKQAAGYFQIRALRLLYVAFTILTLLLMSTVPNSALPFVSTGLVMPYTRRIQPMEPLMQVLVTSIIVVCNSFPIIMDEEDQLLVNVEKYLPEKLAGAHNPLAIWSLAFLLGTLLLVGLEIDNQLEKRLRAA
ncbi:hypothetical protein SARC_04829 [Sphaeroforma arctica JP610]|uniref:SPX domain-containing protein n=1 Tax=Sphaeroforma arctica JP610 TaxID=667725 RepID=A0A0L0G231_9EUKA|nr:hypothetical protein SARC_04829 [Sphaeroforma arctica JP610]KNC82886.1 hypothetical protein SARC_04829 [Sphaeroforma arctica JP610]|eukprot:XP_014156788.1 hypothetical protein SARC_04829 [Sphaeroforma arctica JP610]